MLPLWEDARPRIWSERNIVFEEKNDIDDCNKFSVF